MQCEPLQTPQAEKRLLWIKNEMVLILFECRCILLLVTTKSCPNINGEQYSDTSKRSRVTIKNELRGNESSRVILVSNNPHVLDIQFKNDSGIWNEVF